MGSLLNRHRCPPDGGSIQSKSSRVVCAACRNVSKNCSIPADDSSRPQRRSSRIAISKYSSGSSIAKRVKQRRHARARSCDRRRRNRSPVRKRSSRPRSCHRRRRSGSTVRRIRIRSRSCDRPRRSGSIVRRRRRIQSRSCDRRRRSGSTVKRIRIRARNCDRPRRSGSIVRRRRRRIRSRSCDMRRRSGSTVGRRSRIRSRSCDRRRRNRSDVKKRRSRQRSELVSRRRRLIKRTSSRRRPYKRSRSHSRRRKPGRPQKRPVGRPRKMPPGRPRKKPLERPRGRPRKNAQPLVGRGKGKSLARKSEAEERRTKRERARNDDTISKREVNTGRDADSVFKPPSKVLRATCDKGIDDIQENPLSCRRRCSSVVDAIPARPFDGRQRDQSRRKIPRKRQTRRRAITRKRSSAKRKPRKKAIVKRRPRKKASVKRRPRKKASVKRQARNHRVNKNRNKNAVGSPQRFSKQEVLYMQPGPGEYRPNETNHLSTCDRPASCPGIGLSFVCPYSRRGVEATMCLRSCRRYCFRLRNCGTGRDEVDDISPGAWCTYCHRPIKFIAKRHTSASCQPELKTMSTSEVSTLQPDIREDAI